jgi:hypothetical protein
MQSERKRRSARAITAVLHTTLSLVSESGCGMPCFQTVKETCYAINVEHLVQN